MTEGLYHHWLHELWNGDLDRLEAIAAEVVTDDFEGTWPFRPGLVHGPDELAAVVRQGRTMFDELRFSVAVGPIVQGDLVAARWVAHGAFRGDPVTFHGHDILRVSGDRFREYWVLSEDISKEMALD